MRIPSILLGVSAAALAGCEEAPPPPPPPPAAVVVPAGHAAVVVPPGQPAVVIPTTAVSITTATKAPFGTYLVDSAGRAVYVLEGTRNGPGVNRCSGECLGVWPPVMTAGAPVVAAGINGAMVGVLTGYGGSQATYSGWPLYYYSHDHASGDTTGQDVHDRWGVWHLISPSGEPIRPAGG